MPLVNPNATQRFDEPDEAWSLRLMTSLKTAGRRPIFVFGSNLQGIHGAGAALTASTRYGALRGHGEGLFSASYAIPTKEWNVKDTRPLVDIAGSIIDFLHRARWCHRYEPECAFVITPVGTGRAGIDARIMAPLFAPALHLPNCYLPFAFIHRLVLPE